MNPIAIAQLIQLVNLAVEAASAAQKVGALLEERHAAGREITPEDWQALLTDRVTAQAMLLAAIRQRQSTGD